MGTLILLLILFFVGYPLIKALWRGYQLHRQWRKATEGLRDAFSQAQGQQRRSDPAKPRQKKKKIDPSVGEYVAFEEISCEVKSENADGSTKTTYRRESQVEDVTWEDIDG